jgi:hypothetical protein
MGTMELLTLVSNKKLLFGWLSLLTLSMVTMGDKVYVDRTKELAIVETKLDAIKETVDKMDNTLEVNHHLILEMMQDQAGVKAELKAYREEQKAVKKKD